MACVLQDSASQITNALRPQPKQLQLQGMHDCCDSINDATSLMHCANASSYDNLHKVISTIHKSGGPTLGIGIVTYATQDIWDYTAYSLSVNEAYAEHNGYIMIHLDPRTANYDGSDARWNKVKILEEAIHPETGWARDLDYVMWVDADLIFLDMGLRLEQVAAAHPKAHVIISAEHAGSSTLINSGSVLVRNTRWTRRFLSDWWSFRNRKLFSDQEQFDLLYESRRAEMSKHIAILPPDALNTDPPAMTKQKSHNQVLHLMGEHTHLRVKVFKSAFDEICRVSHGDLSAPLANQLTATRENIHAWTLESYYNEMVKLFALYERNVDRGENTMKQSRKLANSVHHYAHGLEHRNQPGDYDMAVSLRNKTFVLMYRNLQARRKMNSDHLAQHRRILEEWPEHMKAVCEAGQHMTHMGTFEQRKTVGNIVLGLLEELLQYTHREQHPAVMLMIASLHVDIGIIDYEQSNYESALTSFRKSLQLHRKLAEQSGEHILVQPMSILANTLAFMKKYEEAFQYWEECIRITERHVGRSHESLIEILLNYGIGTFVSGGSLQKAKDLIVRCIGVLRSNHFASSDPMYSRALQYLDIFDKKMAGEEL